MNTLASSEKALSLSRPWDYLILHEPFKPIENRPWKTKFRGRIYVHRANSVDRDGWDWIVRHANKLNILSQALDIMALMTKPSLYPSGLVGRIDIVDCVDHSDSPWFFGPYGLVLSKPLAFEKVIPYKGSLGLFEVHL
jgi:hypothetical protein